MRGTGCHFPKDIQEAPSPDSEAVAGRRGGEWSGPEKVINTGSGLPGGSVGKEPARSAGNARDAVSVPGLGVILGGGGFMATQCCFPIHGQRSPQEFTSMSQKIEHC